MTLAQLFFASTGLGLGMHLSTYAVSQVDGFLRGFIITWWNIRAGHHQKWDVMCPTCVKPMQRRICDCCMAVVPPFVAPPPPMPEPPT